MGDASREKRCWLNMKQRCENKNHPRFHQYGGRGIRVVKRWQKYENFLSDMGRAPDKGSLDRIDNDGNYSPSNCRWTTMDVQASNRPRARYYEYGGRRFTLKKISEHLGIPKLYVYEHVRRNGRPIETVVDTFNSRRRAGLWCAKK